MYVEMIIPFNIFVYMNRIRLINICKLQKKKKNKDYLLIPKWLEIIHNYKFFLKK